MHKAVSTVFLTVVKLEEELDGKKAVKKVELKAYQMDVQ